MRRPHIFASALASLALLAGCLSMAAPAYAIQIGSAQQMEDRPVSIDPSRVVQLSGPPTNQISVSAKSGFVSESCVSQVKAIAAKTGTSATQSAKDAAELCSATVTITETAPIRATVAEVKAEAVRQGLSEAETASLVTATATGSIWTRLWTHTYWGGSLVEKHTGRTYWNGTHAWIASATDPGYHLCHSEGGVAVGWAVTVLSCTAPAAGAVADAYYRFDASIAYQGSPITLQVGLHYQTDRLGGVTAWQVGG